MSQKKHSVALKGIGEPHGKQLEILKALMVPDAENVKLIDVCCGRGFGKSLLAIVISVYMLCQGRDQCGLFLEPDSKRMDGVFRYFWRKVVPNHLWTENKKERMITWYNGATLFYGHRNIHGNIETRRDEGRGPNLTFVISDEEAMGCDRQQYTNTLASIRAKSPTRFYLTMTTPKIGEYKNLIHSKGHQVFYGTSHDNPYLPKGFVEQLIETMSRDQVRREIYAEFVALEGRIWKGANLEKPWPVGNVHHQHNKFDPSKPWWLMCDLGSATAAYVVMQQTEPLVGGRRLFHGPVWVAVADLCPYHDGSAMRAFGILKNRFGTPAGISAGNDMSSRDKGDGKTVAYFARKVWGNVPLFPCDESQTSKQIQFDIMSFLFRANSDEVRLCVAKDFEEIEPEGKRGMKQMIEEDSWSEKPGSSTEFLPKTSDVTVQHVRDALLMGAEKIMAPPTWAFNENRVG